MRNSHKLLIEVLDEALRLLANKKEGIERYELWNSIPSFRRTRRVDAYCFEERRSHRSRRSEEWLDLQASNYEKTKV